MAHAPSVPDSAAQKFKLLVVDDDAALLDELRLLLQMAGYEVTTAANGREALDLTLRLRPDLIILDVMMPRKDGYTLCDELKKSEEYKGIVIILLTAVTEAISSTNYTHIGGKTTLADDFIPKPIDLDKLMEIVEDSL